MQLAKPMYAVKRASSEVYNFFIWITADYSDNLMLCLMS